MEVVGSSMTAMDDVNSAVNMDSVSASAHCGGAHPASAAGNEETVNNNLDNVDNASATETARDEDIIGDVVSGKIKRPTSAAISDSVDNVEDDAQSADTVGTQDSADSADVTDGRSMEFDDTVDSMDQSAKGDSNDCESDGDSASESTCLEAMTPDGHDYYLRLGDTPKRRSALRLSRIIARQQLLRRLAQGRTRESYGEVIVCPSVMVVISL